MDGTALSACPDRSFPVGSYEDDPGVLRAWHPACPAWSGAGTPLRPESVRELPSRSEVGHHIEGHDVIAGGEIVWALLALAVLAFMVWSTP
jgi:hypothetical protein